MITLLIVSNRVKDWSIKHSIEPKTCSAIDSSFINDCNILGNVWLFQVVVLITISNEMNNINYMELSVGYLYFPAFNISYSNNKSKEDNTSIIIIPLQTILFLIDLL